MVSTKTEILEKRKGNFRAIDVPIAVGRSRAAVVKKVKGKKNVFISRGPVTLKKGARPVKGFAAIKIIFKKKQPKSGFVIRLRGKNPRTKGRVSRTVTDPFGSTIVFKSKSVAETIKRKVTKRDASGLKKFNGKFSVSRLKRR